MKKTAIFLTLIILSLLAPTLLPASSMASEQPLFSFVVLSDIHIQSWDKQSHLMLKTALSDIQTFSPEAAALIMNGDLTNGMPEDYRQLSDMLKQLAHPPALYSSIGNHEFYKAWVNASGRWSAETFPNGETEHASINRFLQFTGESSVYYEKVVHGHHFLFLGSEKYLQSNPNKSEAAYLSPAQLSWLRQTLEHARLASAEIDKPIFVFLHQPLSETVAGSECCVDNQAVVQDQELRSILSAYPQVILFSSHTHMTLQLSKTMIQDHFTMVSTSSVRQPWTKDSRRGSYKAIDSGASEGLYVEVFTNKVQIKGRDFYKHKWLTQAQFTISFPVLWNYLSLWALPLVYEASPILFSSPAPAHFRFAIHTHLRTPSESGGVR